MATGYISAVGGIPFVIQEYHGYVAASQNLRKFAGLSSHPRLRGNHHSSVTGKVTDIGSTIDMANTSIISMSNTTNINHFDKSNEIANGDGEIANRVLNKPILHKGKLQRHFKPGKIEPDTSHRRLASKMISDLERKQQEQQQQQQQHYYIDERYTLQLDAIHSRKLLLDNEKIGFGQLLQHLDLVDIDMASSIHSIKTTTQEERMKHVNNNSNNNNIIIDNDAHNINNKDISVVHIQPSVSGSIAVSPMYMLSNFNSLSSAVDVLGFTEVVTLVTIILSVAVFIAAGGATLNGTPGLKLRTQYSAATLYCVYDINNKRHKQC